MGGINDEHDVIGDKSVSHAGHSVPSVSGSGFNPGGCDLGGASVTPAEKTGSESILNDAGVNPGIP